MASEKAGRTALNRRTYLGAVGGTVAATPLLGAVSATEHGYETVLNVVDAGGDNTGSESINPILEEALCGNDERDVLVEFPPGTYAMDEEFRMTRFSNVGFVGEDATIVPTDDFDMSRPRLFRLGTYYAPGENLLFEGLDFDFTAEDTGVRVIEAQVTDGLEVRDVRVEGEHDTGTYGPALFDIVDPDGGGLIERMELPDGGAYSVDTDGDIKRGPTGMLVSMYHEGTLEVRDCVVGAFPDNGLYAAGGTGRVIVEGGRYSNSNVSNIRLGGDGSRVRNATVVVDDNRDNDVNQRGIRLDIGSDLRVENVDVRLEKPNGYAITVMGGVESARIEETSVTIGDRTNYGIVVQPDAGPTDIVRTDIEIDGGGYAIQIKGEDAGTVVCEYVTITGEASTEGGQSAIWCGRNDCEFRALDIEQSGPGDRRAIIVQGDDCLLVFGSYRASDVPIVNRGSRTRIYDLSAASFDGREALWLKDGSELEVVRNELANGIRVDDATIAKMYGNDY